MIATFDVESVQRFAKDLTQRRANCPDESHGEGEYCSELDAKMDCRLKLGTELRNAIRDWAMEVFAGRIGFEPQVERIFLVSLRSELAEVQPLLSIARKYETPCYEFKRCTELARLAGKLQFLLDYWVSPKKSVSPGARVATSEEADREIRERVKDMPPLPQMLADKVRLRLRRRRRSK